MKNSHKIQLKLVFGAIAIAAVAIAACPARADLGDTYAQSCRRYSGQGQIAHGNEMLWTIEDGHLWVQEEFHHNQCVAIQYTPVPGRHLYESSIWNLFRINSKPGDHWQQNYTDAYGNPEYVNSDNTIYGKFFPSQEGKGALRICYASWLKRHNLLKDEPGQPSGDDNDRAPVEDNVSFHGFRGDWATRSAHYLC